MAKGNMFGSWAFLIGFILAVVLGVLDLVNPTVAVILFIVGLIAGLMNIADDEATPFLMSGAVLVIVAALGRDAIGTLAWAERILQAVLYIFVPATLVVAIKNVFSLARS